MHGGAYIDKMIDIDQLQNPMAGDRIKSLRSKLGLTQTEMAKLLGYSSYMRVSELENGRAEIPLRVKLIVLSMERQSTDRP
jgi:DNA-binding transcriptional regulator YiaG